MIKVFGWRSQTGIGHASLYLKNAAGEVAYLSYRPETGKTGWANAAEVMIVSAFDNERLAEPDINADYSDYARYGKPVEIDLYKLNEDSIMEFILNYENLIRSDVSNGTQHYYNFYKMNCSHVVGKCLMVGYAEMAHNLGLREKIYEILEESGVSRALSLHRAGGVSHFATACDDVAEIIAVRGAISRNPRFVIGAIVERIAHAFMWTPDDVIDFAEHIKEIEGRIR